MRSLLGSTELVGSSKRIMSLVLAAKNPRASARRCFSPPLKFTPFSAVFVSSPRGSFSMTESKRASCASSSTSAFVCRVPSVMLYSMVFSKISGSCGISVAVQPTSLSPCGSFFPSQSTVPASAVWRPRMSTIRVDLPLPLSPTNAIFLPLWSVRETFSR
jgi:hypothetical protein